MIELIKGVWLHFTTEVPFEMVMLMHTCRLVTRLQKHTLTHNHFRFLFLFKTSFIDAHDIHMLPVTVWRIPFKVLLTLDKLTNVSIWKNVPLHVYVVHINKSERVKHIETKTKHIHAHFQWKFMCENDYYYGKYVADDDDVNGSNQSTLIFYTWLTRALL